MWPRHYFAADYFAPRFFPQSQGTPSDQVIAQGETVMVLAHDRTIHVAADDRTILVPVRPTP